MGRKLGSRNRKPYKRNPAFVIRDAEFVLLYRDGKTLQEIGDKYGVTREYVRQRLSKMGLDGKDGGRTLRSLKRVHDIAKAQREAVARRDAASFSRYGMTRSELRAISDYSLSNEKHPVRIFCRQRQNSKNRGIEWALTFREWWRIWQESGHWSERGRGSGYCMARWADNGPYSAENVYICTIGQNFSDAWLVRPRKPGSRRRNPPLTAPRYWKCSHSYFVQIPGGRRIRVSDEASAIALVAQSIEAPSVSRSEGSARSS